MPWTVPADAQAVRYLDESLKQGRLSHAYMLSGPPGVGVMALARQFAQALLCESGEPPCPDESGCRQCRRIASGVHADLIVVRPTGASGSIGIDAVREIQSAASLQPFEARGKVLILDGAETMTHDAANALLKLLEEPPQNVTLLLTTADEEAIPETVRSRCQILHLRPLPFSRVAEALRERGLDPDEAARLARLAGGRLEAALALADDSAPVEARRDALKELVDVRRSGPSERLQRAGRMADGFYRDREALYTRLDLWASVWRDVLLVAAGAPEGIADSESLSELEAMGASAAEAARVLNEVHFTIDALRHNANPRLALEALLLSLP